jgi:hypothetical protein
VIPLAEAPAALTAMDSPIPPHSGIVVAVVE